MERGNLSVECYGETKDDIMKRILVKRIPAQEVVEEIARVDVMPPLK